MTAVRRLVVRYDRLPLEMRVDDDTVRAVLRQRVIPGDATRCNAAVVLGILPRNPASVSGRLYYAGVQAGAAYRCTKRREADAEFCRFHLSPQEQEALCGSSV